MKIMYNNYDMLNGANPDNDALNYAFASQRAQLLNQAVHDKIFENQRTTIVHSGNVTRIGIMKGDKKAYAYLGKVEDYINIPRYKYEVVCNLGMAVEGMDPMPLYFTDDLEYAEEIRKESLRIASERVRKEFKESPEYIEEWNNRSDQFITVREVA